ncbi:MAG: carbohydrate kinase family protein [Candidatus Hodarchaeota archaeon]
MFDLVIVGHLAIDWVESSGKGYASRLGGPPAFCGLAAKTLGVKKVAIISKVGYDFSDDFLSVLVESGIDISALNKVEGPTTRFHLKYYNGERELKLTAKCEPIYPDDVPDTHLRTKATILSPIASEIPDETLDKFLGNPNIVATDLQGFVRRFDDQGNTRIGKWRNLERFIRNIDVIKGTEEEITMACGLKDVKQGALDLLRYGAKIVIVTRGQKGALFWMDGEYFEVKALRSVRHIDSTGAGDILLSGFVVELQRTDDVYRAARFATIMSSLSLEGLGIGGMPTRDAVEERMK